jgi:DNA-binding NtrC family response regulator
MRESRLSGQAVVLVADADASTAAAFRQAALGSPVVIEVAETSQRVWRFLAGHVPAAIFASLRLEGADGLSLLEQVGEQFPRLIRVLYTAEAAPPRGVDIPVLAKPCDPEALRELLRAVAALAAAPLP